MPENRGSWQDPKAHSPAIKDCKENLCLSPSPGGQALGVEMTTSAETACLATTQSPALWSQSC